MSDCKWLNSYFAVTGGREYPETTGHDGRWVYTRGVSTPIGNQVSNLLSRTASITLQILWAILPFVPGLVMLGLTVVLTCYAVRFIASLVVDVFQYLIGAIPYIQLFIQCLIQFVSDVFSVVYGTVSTVIHDIVQFISGVIDGISRPM